jgi:hypothetical protein
MSKEEYATFEQSLKKVLSVSHAEMKIRLEKAKQKRPKHASSRRASKTKA